MTRLLIFSVHGLVLGASLGILLSGSTPGEALSQTESVIAERFAPQLMHPHDEPNLPTNVEWFLPKTTLTFQNSDCPQDNTELGTASLDLLATATLTSSCSGHVFRASGTRSASRSRTFILNDVAPVYKAGSSDPSDWYTYFHAFRNSANGWTIQYWSFYSFNTGKKVGPMEIGYHGGDWEMAEVVLDSQDKPTSFHSTGHTAIESVLWDNLTKNGTHPIIYSEKGGHEVHIEPQEPAPYIIHETWSGGVGTFPGSSPKPVGKLVDLGSKLHPKQQFLLYSGLWGSIGGIPISSGYWGPAFNETGMRNDNFLAAWCDGINDPNQGENGKRECFPDDPQ